MREIKFRGKRFDTKDWIYGDLLDNSVISSGGIDVDNEYISIDEWCSIIPSTIGQYTGLKDKNGVEIFELDYAEKDGCIYLVMWYKNKYILKDISNGDIIELDKNINVRSNYYENAEKFTGEYSKI